MASSMTAAEEVADDYRRELEELSGINRAEISTLTMIARESTEHASAISDVLVQHILKVRDWMPVLRYGWPLRSKQFTS